MQEIYNMIVKFNDLIYHIDMTQNTNLGELVEEVSLNLNPDKLIKISLLLKKLINLVIDSTSGDLKASLINKLVEVVIIVENAEKGETNVGRNSSYPE